MAFRGDSQGRVEMGEDEPTLYDYDFPFVPLLFLGVVIALFMLLVFASNEVTSAHKGELEVRSGVVRAYNVDGDGVGTMSLSGGEELRVTNVTSMPIGEPVRITLRNEGASSFGSDVPVYSVVDVVALGVSR